jgi:hypothetical protein
LKQFGTLAHNGDAVATMSGEQNEKIKIEDEIDALFKLPLAEFTVARNALASRLKQTGHREEVERVKSIQKPSSSAWAVNQLYWNHRDAFDRLIATSQRFSRAQASQHANKAADMREALAERREALSNLTREAGALLRDAGHNPAPDTMRRVTATLEALTTGSSAADAPRAGRLLSDMGPPGFESLAELAPSSVRHEQPRESTRAIPFKQPASAGVSKREELRQAKIAAAKAAVEHAERVLLETQTMAQDVVAELKEATAHADAMEKNRKEAEERFDKARIAASEARQRLQKVTVEATKAAKLLENAERALAKAEEDAASLES